MPAPLGSPLTETDLTKLADSWITPELADAAGLRRVTSHEGGEIIGRNGRGDYSGIVIPYTLPGDSAPRENMLRVDYPELEARPDGTFKEKQKYIAAPGRGNLLYFPPGVTLAMLADSALPIIFCEGAKKALALWRLASKGVDYRRFLPIAISGVWNWRGTVGREPGPDGSRRSVKGPISDLARITWNRIVYILFDSDKRRNPSIRAAERELARELKSRGASVKIVDLPDLPGFDKTGADDFLANPAGGPERLLALISGAKDLELDLLHFLANDHGNAERIIAAYGDELRYCHQFKKWLTWDSRRWSVDTTGQATRIAKLAMLEYLRQAVTAKNDGAERFARSSLNARMLKQALELAQCEIFVQPADLDADPHSVCFKNGAVDLRTGELIEHDRERFITRMINFDYDPEAKCPAFLTFLYRIMGLGQDEDRANRMVAYLQKAIGYSLSGVTSEKAVFVCWGGGDNGKTTLLATIRRLFSEYATLLQIDTLMARRDESTNASADLADLHGARFVMTSETEEGQRLSEGKLKRITQGLGTIKTCRKYENPFEFPETHKLWIDANHKPIVRGTDNAIWNRLHLIPFDVTIPKDEQEPELPAKLLAQAEGIIAWVVRGAVRWHAEGLGRPPEVEQAAEAWREESDPLRDFLEDCCELGPEATCKSADLWAAYGQWADRNGEKRNLSRKKFSERLVGHGCDYYRDPSARMWRGISVR